MRHASPVLVPLAAVLCMSLTACASLRSSPPPASPATATPAPPPAPPANAGSSGATVPTPEAPVPRPAPKTWRLSPAAESLVTQAQTATAKGEYVAATATLERAIRIEPDNPLVWIQLGRTKLAAGDPAQAENMGKRALALAAGAPREQASASQLINDAVRAQGGAGRL